MKKFFISKRNGEQRLIYAPSNKEKRELKLLVSEISKKAMRASPEGVIHGFVHKRSPVTNALAHVNHEFTLCFDLKDFFDSVKIQHIQGKLPKEQIELVFVDGAPRQGLPTSPAVANLAAASMDQAIIKWRDKHKYQFVYTRYADDLSFSYDEDITKILMEEIPLIASRCGFKINDKKTKLQSAKQGRRIITGVAVDNSLNPTRKTKRKLRAAIHQKKLAQANGLSEWCKLKLPKEKSKEIKSLEDLIKVWKLGKIPLDKLPSKPEEELDDNCIITGDVVYTLGMSTFTTGWTSCMSQPNGQYRKGVIFWAMLKGTRVAAFLSDKTKVFGSIS